MSQLTLDQEVDAWWAEQPQRPVIPVTARITCRVCNKPAEVPILSSGLLCCFCRQDLDATEAHICQTLAVAEQAAEEAWERWEADRAHADPADQERYSRVCAAQDTPGFTGRYARALTKGDGLSALLRSAERAKTALGAMQRTRAWSNAALDEVEAARDATH